MNSMTVAARTIMRFWREKSTNLPIMNYASLLHGVLEDERVGDHHRPGLDPPHDFLHVVRQHVAGTHFQAAESPVSDRRVHPFTIVQVKNGARRDRSAALRRF